MHAEKLPDAEVRGDDHAPMRCRAIEQPARPSQSFFFVARNRFSLLRYVFSRNGAPCA
jgi:hypothetical protein